MCLFSVWRAAAAAADADLGIVQSGIGADASAGAELCTGGACLLLMVKTHAKVTGTIDVMHLRPALVLVQHCCSGHDAPYHGAARLGFMPAGMQLQFHSTRVDGVVLGAVFLAMQQL
jgi:hypothetical protein